VKVPDTSLIVPALVEWLPQHDVAGSALSPAGRVVGHCLIEAYSVLTRLLEPHRLASSIASEALARLFRTTLVLDDEITRTIPSRLHAAGIRGGATSDGVIALIAAHHEATLVTLDAKAAGTYRACGVRFELVGA